MRHENPADVYDFRTHNHDDDCCEHDHCPCDDKFGEPIDCDRYDNWPQPCCAPPPHSHHPHYPHTPPARPGFDPNPTRPGVPGATVPVPGARCRAVNAAGAFVPGRIDATGRCIPDGSTSGVVSTFTRCTTTAKTPKGCGPGGCFCGFQRDICTTFKSDGNVETGIHETHDCSF